MHDFDGSQATASPRHSGIGTNFTQEGCDTSRIWPVVSRAPVSGSTRKTTIVPDIFSARTYEPGGSTRRSGSRGREVGTSERCSLSTIGANYYFGLFQLEDCLPFVKHGHVPRRLGYDDRDRWRGGGDCGGGGVPRPRPSRNLASVAGASM